MDIIIHADDFGIAPEQSERILQCARNGALNSLSVLVGSPAFEQCANLLEDRPAHLRVGLHLNLVEGPCCADPGRIPMLADANGMFCNSFAGLLRLSMSSRHYELVEQVAIEAQAQLERFLGRFSELAGRLRIDGHQHFQLIPAVFEGMLLALDRVGCTVEYVRIPAESLKPFIDRAVLATIEPVNWAKHGMLNFCWQQNCVRLQAQPFMTALFCGVLFSGEMSAGRVAQVMPAYIELARLQGMDVEFLFHPGGVEDAHDMLNPDLDGFVDFYRSPGRRIEYDALMSQELARCIEQAKAQEKMLANEVTR